MNITIIDGYKVITPKEGYVLTTYLEGDDIKEYSSFNKCVCPIGCDISHLREITIEESKEYIKLAKK